MVDNGAMFGSVFKMVTWMPLNMLMWWMVANAVEDSSEVKGEKNVLSF